MCRMMVVKCCGYCEHHKENDGEWICDCEETDEYGLETDFEHSCDEFERR